MQQHSIRGRHRPGPGRLSPGELGATFPRSRRVAVRPRVLRRRVAAAFAGTILVGAGIGWAAQADAQPYSDDPAPFDWDDLYVGVITGQSPSSASVATSWEDLMVPTSLREGGVS